MTFIGTFVIMLLSMLAAIILIFGAKAYVAGGFFGILAIGLFALIFKIVKNFVKDFE